jgi:hypothetical protein
MVRKTEKNVLRKRKTIERHSTCMVRSEKMAMEDGCFFFFFFWVSKFWKILIQK